MSKMIFIRLFSVLSLLVSVNSLVHAKNVYGYVITSKNDTVYGTVRLSKFNLSQQTVSVFSYNMDELYDHVYFCQSGSSGFQELFPDDIQEYGFMLDRMLYKYMSKEVKATLGNTKRKFFLQRADGAISLFEIRWYYDSQDKSLNPGGMITEYFIQGEDKSLIKVTRNDNAETVTAFLMGKLKLNQDVLVKVTQDKSFKDIVEIARSYNAEIKKSAN